MLQGFGPPEVTVHLKMIFKRESRPQNSICLISLLGMNFSAFRVFRAAELGMAEDSAGCLS